MSLADELSIFLKKKEISIYQIATDIDVERSYLSRMIQGKRPMPFDVFQKIIDYVCASKNELSKLKGKFIEENFGSEEFERFVEYFKSIYDSEETSGNKKVESKFNFTSEFEYIDSSVTIATLSDSIISNILSSDEKVRLYTNFNPSLIYETVKSTMKPENVDYKHIIMVENEGSSLFESLFTVLKFNYCGYGINYIESANGKSTLTDSLYPNYILTDNYCLLVDNEYKSGVFVSNQDFVDANIKKFESVFEKTTPYLQVQSDMFDLQKFIQNNLTENLKVDITCLASFFNSVLYADLEMYEQFARKEIPNREFTMQLASAHYQKFTKMNIRAVVTKRCIEDFANTGIIDSFPPELVEPMTVENRIKILERFKENIENDNIIYRVLKPGFFKNDMHKITNTIDFETYHHVENEINNFSALVSLRDIQKSYIGNYTYNFSNEQIVSDFNNFVSMLSISDYCYTKDETIQIFEDEAEKLRLRK